MPENIEKAAIPNERRLRIRINTSMFTALFEHSSSPNLARERIGLISTSLEKIEFRTKNRRAVRADEYAWTSRPTREMLLYGRTCLWSDCEEGKWNGLWACWPLREPTSVNDHHSKAEYTIGKDSRAKWSGGPWPMTNRLHTPAYIYNLETKGETLCTGCLHPTTNGHVISELSALPFYSRSPRRWEAVFLARSLGVKNCRNLPKGSTTETIISSPKGKFRLGLPEETKKTRNSDIFCGIHMPQAAWAAPILRAYGKQMAANDIPISPRRTQFSLDEKVLSLATNCSC